MSLIFLLDHEPKEQHVSRNPYDRRAAHRDDGTTMRQALDGGAMIFGGAPPTMYVPPAVLTLRDLDELAGRKMAEAREAAYEQGVDAERERSDAKRRRAWDEGHEAGRVDGARALREHYDSALGGRMHALHGYAAELDSAVRLVAGQISETDAGFELDVAKRMLRDTTKGSLLAFIATVAKETDRAIKWHNGAAVDIAERGGESLPF